MNSTTNPQTTNMFNSITWDFPTQDVNCHTSGAVQLGFQSFSSELFASITREAIQNSLDASRTTDKPVEVKFVYSTIDLSNDTTYDNFLSSAEDHIHLCKQKYADDEQKAKTYDDMLRVIKRFRKIKRLPYLQVSDSGTIGMYYDDQNPAKGRMCSFMHEDGENTSDSKKGGGANGFGKMAYFAMSPLHMVLASTHAIRSREDDPQTGKSFFSGAMKLATHPCPTDNTLQYQYAGYFPGIPKGIAFKPLTDVSNLPLRFSRRELRKESKDLVPELGTTFYIIGCEPGDLSRIINSKEYDQKFQAEANKIYMQAMLPAVLRNYFASIKRGKLKVILGHSNIQQTAKSITISASDGLNIRMSTTFNDSVIRRGNLQKSLNPYPFLQAMNDQKGTEDDEKRICHFELDLDNVDRLKQHNIPAGMRWGKVRLYLNINPDFGNNMILAMRSPLMTVYQFPVNVNRGSYAGVLICDEEGNFANQLLRAAEPATHDKWDAKQAPLPGHGESEKTAQALLETLTEWVNMILDDLFPQTNTSDIFHGLREFLPTYNPEDASQRDADLNKSDLAVKEETSRITIRKRGKNDKGSKVSSRRKDQGRKDPEGNEYTGGAGGNKGGHRGGGYSDPDKTVTADPDSKRNLNIVREVPLKVRSFAEKEADGSGYVYTVLLSGAEDDFENIDLQLCAQGERSKEPLKILSAQGNKLQVQDTKILGISIKKGESVKLKVKFKLNTNLFSLRAISTIEAAKESNNNSSDI